MMVIFSIFRQDQRVVVSPHSHEYMQESKRYVEKDVEYV